MTRPLFIFVSLLLASCSEPHKGPPPEATPGIPNLVQLPGVTVNLTDRYAEMNGLICLREGLLELVATLPAGKEHESIVSLDTRPSNLHAGLLLLGLKPGKPGEWRYLEDRVEAIDPTGDRVRVTLLYEHEGIWVELPIQRFIVGKDGKRHLPGSEFVFAGSYLAGSREGTSELEYAADLTGDVIALVSFGTEVLAWPKAASESNDDLYWLADPDTVPELGTPVKVRIYPVDDEAK